MSKIVVLEGFFDSRPNGDIFPAFLMSPVVQCWEPGSFNLAHNVEEIGIDLWDGGELTDEARPDWDMDALQKSLARAKKAHQEGRDSPVCYFKVELEIFDEDSDEPFRLVSYEGAKELDPTGQL